ncbi:hypothetical protein V5799_015688 [Amblyomma americanum]|uniref:BPTI/Kunitz inhibitor domain-containing protein n=1 Tax=Amblyomma americanum TaxID=6943 RepID=A0AAQ4F808_AMBAM
MKAYILLAVVSSAFAIFQPKQEATVLLSEPAKKKPDLCFLPPYPGPCVAFIPRFYYEAKTNQCKSFLYGGCHGNGNSFETMRECFAVCATLGPVPIIH